ncbi:MAG: hypothetical protein U9P00_09795, partial [Pseudomonadota bacterium]|nr:hypothetical protein [Pseudomonadota bacterium]
FRTTTILISSLILNVSPVLSARLCSPDRQAGLLHGAKHFDKIPPFDHLDEYYYENILIHEGNSD